MPRLTIQHVPDSSPPQFQLRREQDGKTTDPVEIPSPYQRQAGEGDRVLMDELRWYLENFLEYPFEPWTDRADRVLGALEEWGTEAFDALFGGGDGKLWLRDARREGDVQIAVSADDPHVLSWPWEGLYDPRRDWLVHQHAVTRRLNDVDDPPLLPDLPDDRVNVLLVTARPLDEDAPYRSIARPLVETVKEQELPASITVLRPPTFDNLREHLRERPGHYHVVHFDGHGGYLEEPGTLPGNQHQLRGPQGHLVFETAGDFDPDPIPAGRLSQLLRDHNIPAAVLNACQSGMVDDAADDAFASVAASLLRAGVHSVVAMSHAVMVSGAREFVPPFYERLFETGSLAEAARAGRREMLAHPERVCVRGRFPLQDWLVPVVYEQAEAPFDFVADAEPPTDEAPDLPDPPEEVQGPYGFVGRDRALLQLERAMERAPAGVLFHGLGGIGKTTLVWGFLRWLADTGGLAHEPFWFTFSEIQSAEYVLNRIGERFYGDAFATLDTDEKLDRLVATLDEEHCVLVWDNFESAAAMDEEAGEALLSENDRETLRTLLRRLQGTESKVLITSRSTEAWLGGPAYVQRHPLGGLQGEERWRFTEEIVDDLPGVTLDREDDALKKLMDTLRGHPLAMSVVLPRLADRSPEQLEETVRHNLDELDPTDDEVRDRLYATLGLVDDVLDELQELLIPLRLHERFIRANQIGMMADRAESDLSQEQVSQGLQKLEDVGLLQNVGNGFYAVHPALTGYLRAREHNFVPASRDESWMKAFVGFMSEEANLFARKQLREQKEFFRCHGKNLIHSRDLARENDLLEEWDNLVEFLALFSFRRGLLDESEQQVRSLLDVRRQQDDQSGIAAAQYQLGRTATRKGNFEQAEQWFHRAADFFKQEEAARGIAKTYHELGNLGLNRGELEEAERWYQKAFEIRKDVDDEHGIAQTYIQLGKVALRRRRLERAKELIQEVAEMSSELGNERLEAGAHHDLGIIAREQGRRKEAHRRFRRAAEIEERIDNWIGAARSYNNLGGIELEAKNYEEGEEWLRRSAEIKERLNDRYGAAKTYHELGRSAVEQRDLEQAEKWYGKARDIFEELGEEHDAAKAYDGLGTIARLRGNRGEAEKWYRRAVEIFESEQDEYGAALTYTNLGSLCYEGDDIYEAARCLIKAIPIFRATKDERRFRQAARQFGQVLLDASPEAQDDLRPLWADAGLPEDELDDLLDQLD